ncbi:MAG: glyoxalase [Cyanothece sp. SIO1E1]|nr:glyoxalase [Cyanothece sp. SIO1E1]
MQITQPLHAALLVSDLKSAEHFYGSILGLAKIERSLRFPGAWYQIGEFQVHLIAALEGENPLQNPEKLGRNRHIAFAVADLAAAKAHLTKHGIEVQMSASGRAALFAQDPDGNVIELTELSHARLPSLSPTD